MWIHVTGLCSVSVSAKLSPGCSLCLLCSSSQVWDAVHGAELLTLAEHATSVSFCMFLSKGEKIIAVSNTSVKVMSRTLNNMPGLQMMSLLPLICSI